MMAGPLKMAKLHISASSVRPSRARLCSGDADCADHDSVHAQADRMLHGAAYHGCLLVSETSCEARNVSVDRALLVDTAATVGAVFF
jgi:hypothetical protein